MTATLSQMLVDEAVGVLGTRVVSLAGVDTVPVLTGAVQWAFGVRLASDGDASGDRISLISADASTVGNVTLRVALCIDAAGIVQQTRVDTFAIAAGFSILTLGVGLTTHGFAFDLRVAHSALGALTDGPVVGEEAVCTLAAVTGVHADSVETSGILLALVISHTSGRIGSLDGHTATVSIW